MKSKLKLHLEATTKVVYTYLLATLLLSLENILKLLYTILVFAVVFVVEVLLDWPRRADHGLLTPPQKYAIEHNLLQGITISKCSTIP